MEAVIAMSSFKFCSETAAAASLARLSIGVEVVGERRLFHRR
jgi:hypothetical protein